MARQGKVDGRSWLWLGGLGVLAVVRLLTMANDDMAARARRHVEPTRHWVSDPPSPFIRLISPRVSYDAAAAGNAQVTAAVVTARPPEARYRALYPADALKSYSSGIASVRCAIQPDGRLTGCTVTDQTPAKGPFGAAALLVAQEVRITPPRLNGQPVASPVVTLPIRFGLIYAESRLVDDPVPAARLAAAKAAAPLHSLAAWAMAFGFAGVVIAAIVAVLVWPRIRSPKRQDT